MYFYCTNYFIHYSNLQHSSIRDLTEWEVRHTNKDSINMIILVNIPWERKIESDDNWQHVCDGEEGGFVEVVWRTVSIVLDRSRIKYSIPIVIYILSNQLIKSIIKMKFTLLAVAATLSAVSAFTSVSLILTKIATTAWNSAFSLPCLFE